MRARMARWVRERQGPDRLPVALQRRRLYILPTRRGVAFSILLLPMLLAGLNYANSLALFLTFLLGAWTLVAMQQCHRNLQGIVVAGAQVAPRFAATAGTLAVILANPGGGMRLAIGCSLNARDDCSTELPPGGRRQIVLPLPARRRGIHPLGRVRIYTTQPFGLFRAWTWLHAPIEELVYPEPRGQLAPPPGPGDPAAQTRAVGDTEADEWSGLRPFRDGDSPRHVDWKAYAREAPLLVKEYRASGVRYLFDLRQPTQADLEARLSQLARWIVDADARGERYGLKLDSVTVPPGRGREQRHRCLAALAAFSPP